MNNTDIFANPLQTVNFLSVFTSITTLSDIFYNEKLLTNESKLEPIPIVNALCDYLNKTNDSAEITALGHKLLNNTDFYGSKGNETIHLKYVDAMFDQIIASTVFSKFFNTFGYLSAIVNSTNNLTLSFVKRKIVLDLKHQRFLNEDGTISSLSNLTITRVIEKLIFPLFPQPENDMKIIDVDYIYAQAGLMLARIARINPQNISFDEYITLAQTVEAAVFQGEMDQDGLKIFQLPALLYYTHKKKDVFTNQTIENIITSDELWHDAFNLLFSELNVAFDRINKLQEENPEYQFHVAYSGYKNRTKLAEETYRKFCPLVSESDYPKEVNNYKYSYSDSHCKTDKRLLPNINKIYDEQNKHITNKYFLLEKALIREAFSDDLIKLVDQENVRVYPCSIRPKLICAYRCYTLYQKLNSTINLFGIRINRTKPRLYALIRNESNMTLLSADAGLKLFKQKLKLKNGSTFECSYSGKVLKSGSETFDDLASNIAKPREKKFLEMLEKSGYDATTGEQVIASLADFIPFYGCYKASQTGVIEEIGFTCMMDAVSMIPLVGQVSKIGLLFAKAAVKPLLLSFGSSMKTFISRQSINLALKTGIGAFALEAGKEFSKIITREFFKGFGIAVLRTLDPGIELSYMLGKAGTNAILKCLLQVVKKIPSLDRVVLAFKNLKETVITKVVGTFENHNVFVNTIFGNDGYGIKYVRLEEPTVELRRVLGYKSEQSVVQISGFKRGKKVYQLFDLKTEEIHGQPLEVKNDVLQAIPPSLAVRLENILVTGLSGKGKLPGRRVRDFFTMHATRENAVNSLMLYMDENIARETLCQYVLEDFGRTPADFARYWIDYQELPEWSKDLKLNDVNLYESLRYDAYLEDCNLTEDVAVKRILDFYGTEHVKNVIGLDPKELFQFYLKNKLHSICTFEDYYAIRNLMSSGISRIDLETPEAWRMFSAIYRSILRQFDSSDFSSPKILYKAEKKPLEDLPMFQNGKEMNLNRLDILNIEMSKSLQYLTKNINDNSHLKIFYEIRLDNSYLVVNGDRYLPTVQKDVVLLPEVKFFIENVNFVLINGERVLKVTLKNVPVSKSKWLVELTNNIKSANEKITLFNFAISNFDLSLIN